MAKKQRPDIDEETRTAIEMRAAQRRRMPTFRRQEWFRYRRLGTAWRRPKGLHSKMRKRLRYRPPLATVGYRTPRKARGLHPSGFREVLVHRPADLDGIDPKVQAARIAHSVGVRKRIEIIKRADDLGIRVLNRGEG
ncbi:MAG TPA: 50S ribosomal protein L32e [Thermoplasmata archaeon]|nr:50S ribosomal protein L32e [Thermoplasmata archaeon]